MDVHLFWGCLRSNAEAQLAEWQRQNAHPGGGAASGGREGAAVPAAAAVDEGGRDWWSKEGAEEGDPPEPEPEPQ